ncbi:MULTISPECIES: non-canonical purine NTP pyrophosphatase [unclassified Streptomyces]|uniref:non-canonical purine NTP pyrophosphatase n=1 Tax=unclassified Streptomyces TaxID=2593676 RepID=UPI00342C2066
MPVPRLAYCTGNAGKFATAQEHLAPWGIEIEQVSVDLDEIQTTSVEEIARHKARQAFVLLGRQLFVEDSGFFIDEFNGWPGPMVKHALEAIGPRGLTHLADLTAKRTCRFASAVVYVDARGELHAFADDLRKPGHRCARAGQRSWSDLWSIFVPEGCDTTLSALPAEEQDRLFTEWRKHSVISALGAWLAGRHTVES